PRPPLIPDGGPYQHIDYEIPLILKIFAAAVASAAMSALYALGLAGWYFNADVAAKTEPRNQVVRPFWHVVWALATILIVFAIGIVVDIPSP
ncbi:MAG: hypothetical protein ACRDD1_11230, partial [Planctomycetia bacterium]